MAANLEIRQVDPPLIHIADRERAEENHRKITTSQQPPFAIYTGGSGINGKVGAAAVSLATNTHRTAFLGGKAKATVYSTELLGILTGLNLAIDSDVCNAAIFTDNQAAYGLLNDQKDSPGKA